MDWGVVHEMPDEPTNEAESTLVRLGSFNNLLLNGTKRSPHTCNAGTLLPIRTCHEDGIVWAQRGSEHARTPRPVHGVRLQRFAKVACRDVTVHKLVHNLNIGTGNDSFLFTWVRDFRDGRDRPFIRFLACLLNAAVVAIADGVDAVVALLVDTPRLVVAGLHSKSLVHQDPTSTSGTLLTRGLLWHEVVRRLDADADVFLIGSISQSDLVEELRRFFIL